jgi:hypothetical protein
MNLSRDYYTTLDFNELKDRLKSKVGTNYKLGLIDNEEISLFSSKGQLCQKRIGQSTDL